MQKKVEVKKQQLLLLFFLLFLLVSVAMNAKLTRFGHRSVTLALAPIGVLQANTRVISPKKHQLLLVFFGLYASE